MSLKLMTIVVLLFLVAFFGMFLFIDSFDSKLSEATGLVVSTESFPVYLETHPVFKSLPKDASVEVVIGETTYELNDRGVYLSDEALDKKDISISLPEGYESRIGELGLCSAIKEAIKNNEIKVESYSSKFSLVLKYHKLLKYSDCLG